MSGVSVFSEDANGTATPTTPQTPAAPIESVVSTIPSNGPLETAHTDNGQ